MALLFQIDDATLLDEGVWKARISPSEVRFLAPKAEGAGDITVLLLLEEPQYDTDQKRLAFDPTKAKLLNAGTSDIALVVGNLATVTVASQSKSAVSLQAGSGDAKFMSALPPHLNELGRAILAAVRSIYPGDLTFYEASGKYVEAPDNFWTIRPQPRDESFRVIVRGRPDLFVAPSTLKIKPDMGGYSSFKIERVGQVEEFMEILAQVRRK